MTQLKTKPSSMSEDEELDNGRKHTDESLSLITTTALKCDSEKGIVNIDVFHANLKTLNIPCTENTSQKSSSKELSEEADYDCDAENADSLLLLKKREDCCCSSTSVDSISEPGKYVFQLLPIHCVKGKGGRKIYKCDVCGGIYRHAFSLKRHYLRSHLNYEYLSEADLSNCSITIQSNGSRKSGPSLMESKKAKRSLTNPTTVIASAEQNVSNYEINGRSKKNNGGPMPGLFRCHTCGELFDELKDLKFHVTNHPDQPNNRRYSCPQCDMTFSHRQNLVRHLSVHSGEKPHACRYCGKRFPTATNQKRHERIHEGVKPYVCSHCASVFTQSGDLKKHIRKQHGHHFHPCALCVKYFSSEKGLADHVLGHGHSVESNVRVQGKRTGSLSAMRLVSTQASCQKKVSKVQTTVSTTNHKYCCSTCKKRFKTFLSLSRHRRSAHGKSTRGAAVHSKSSTSTRRKPANSPYSTSASRSPKYNDDIILRDPPATEADFYADIAYNISDNLLNHLDGKLYVVQQPTPPTEDDSQAIFGKLDSVGENLTPQLSWSKYNFPPNFHCEQDDKDASWCSDTSCSRVQCEVYDLSKRGYCQSPCDSTYVDSVAFSHSEMMHSLALSPVTSEYSGGIPCVDGVLDLSMPNKGDSAEHRNSIIPRGLIEVELPKTFVCLACGENYPSLDDMENHKINNHPNVYCTHIELEGIKDMPLGLFKQHCSPVGVLKNCPVPPALIPSGQLVCTKCHRIFFSVPELHSHMLDCGGHSEAFHSSRKRHGKFLSIKKKCVAFCGMKRKLEDTPFKKNSFIVNATSKKLKKDFVLASKRFLDSRTGHNESKFNCDGCEHRFSYLSGLERHKRGCPQKLALRKKICEPTKDIRQQHSCPNCCRSFTYLASLKKHILDCAPLKESKSTMESKSSKTKNAIVMVKSTKNSGLGKTYKKNESFKSNVKKTVSSDVDENEILAEATKLLGVRQQDVMAVDSSDTEMDNLPPIVATKEEVYSTKLEGQLLTEAEVNNEGLMLLGEVCEGQASLECIKNLPKEIKEEHDEGDEDDDARGLGNHSCPHCYRTYTYLANFKKHVKEACPLRKDLLKGDESLRIEEVDRDIKNEDPAAAGTLPEEPVSFLQAANEGDELEEILVKDTRNAPVGQMASISEVESETTPTQDGTLAPQINIETTSGENVSGQAKQANEEYDHLKATKLQPYCCPTCHRIFLSYVKLLQHQLSHKLNILNIDVGCQGDKCSATIDTSTEFIQQSAKLCSIKKTDVVLPNVPSEILTATVPSSSNGQTKHKGGWPKGKSRKGYVAKNKRNSSDAPEKEGADTGLNEPAVELSNGEINGDISNKDTKFLMAIKRPSPKNGASNSKKAKSEHGIAVKISHSKKENDNQLIRKKPGNELLDVGGFVESSVCSDTGPVSPTALSCVSLESRGNNSPNSKRVTKPKLKKPSCLLTSVLPSSKIEIFPAVTPTFNS